MYTFKAYQCSILIFNTLYKTQAAINIVHLLLMQEKQGCLSILSGIIWVSTAKKKQKQQLCLKLFKSGVPLLWPWSIATSLEMKIPPSNIFIILMIQGIVNIQTSYPSRTKPGNTVLKCM